MAQQPSPTIQNHFQAGLKTEFTGLNFPENAATDTANCVYTVVGDVQRRGGFNYEANFQGKFIDLPGVARSSFRWLNAGGDGQSQILVFQTGNAIQFYLSSSATVSSPLSTTLLSNTVDLNQAQAQGNTANVSLSECQYSAGNGYLFIFHPNCEPLYCTYISGQIQANVITLQTRDLIGIPEPGVADNFRPNSLSNEHLYNLLNQGWTQGSGWSGTASFGPTQGIPLSNANPSGAMSLTLTSQSNTTTIVPGDIVSLVLQTCAGTSTNPHVNGVVTLVGTVNTYTTPNITLTITQNNNPALNATGFWNGGNFTGTATNINLTLVNEGFITKWNTSFNNYPSNSDVWWLYKDTTNAFNPTTTAANVQPSNTPAPKGYFLINPFIQNRNQSAQIGGLTNISTVKRPSTGAFYNGRVFYAGVNDSFAPTGDAPFTTWTENIYFSQIVESPVQFGRCYQTNDPTSQNLFSLLPSDGGVITIPGCGNVYKLFALRYGILVFAANGIWFISGSSGIGFTANDYVITKISNIEAIAGTSFIEVQGYPFFWNQEGIYQVTPSAQPGSAHSPDIQLSVTNLCVGTIQSYYNNIPLFSKFFARGDYDQLNFVIQWCFRGTAESGIGNRYEFDTILNYNVVTKAFYPFLLPAFTTFQQVCIYDIKYIQNPGGTSAPPPIFKYITHMSNGAITFSEENDFTRYVDFFSDTNAGVNFTSSFVTGYSSPGQDLRKFQTPYIYVFSRNPLFSQCSIQAIWDWVQIPSPGSGIGPNHSSKVSTRQIITMKNNQFYRKVRLRGRGLATQIKVSSIPGQPFDLMGWSVWNEVQSGI